MHSLMIVDQCFPTTFLEYFNTAHLHFSLIKQVISSLVETPRPEMVDEGDMQYVQLLQGTPRTWSGTSSYVYMDTLCFSRMKSF